MEIVKKKMLDVIKHSDCFLPKKTISDADELIKHKEYGIALEIICTQLYEFDCRINNVLYSKIKDSAELMDMTPKTYNFLRELVE